MNALSDPQSYFAAYQMSFLVLAVLALMVVVQNFLTAPLAFIKEEQVPGMPLRFDHAHLSFRALRTYANSAESFPAFGWALLAAIVSGAPAGWVNGLALAFLGFRLAFWVIYYSGVGRIAGGPRTLCFVGGLLANAALAVMAIYAVLS